jgi:hypothetical protein
LPQQLADPELAEIGIAAAAGPQDAGADLDPVECRLVDLPRLTHDSLTPQRWSTARRNRPPPGIVPEASVEGKRRA